VPKWLSNQCPLSNNYNFGKMSAVTVGKLDEESWNWKFFSGPCNPARHAALGQFH